MLLFSEKIYRVVMYRPTHVVGELRN